MSSIPVRRSMGGTPGRPGDRGPDLLCRINYTNRLPDIPFDGKFLPCPFVALDRFVEYKPSTLERDHKFEVQCEADIGVNIDLIDPATYAVGEEKVPMDDEDLLLLEDDAGKNKKGINSKRSQQHSRVVPWMRKTEYISHEFNRFGVSADRQETKVGYGMKKKGETELYRDRASQIAAIEKSFQDVKKPVKDHYSKKGVYAVEELPILPDFNWWKHAFAQVIFDADPSMPGVSEEHRADLLDQGQIRGMQDDEGNQFVAYFTPTIETMEKRKKERAEGVHDPDYLYDHVINREYNWDVKNKATKGYENENYFFTFREGAVFYNELETRVRLIRRRICTNKNSRLRLHLTEAQGQEEAAMNARQADLLQPFDTLPEEDEEQQDEEEEGGEAQEGGSNKSDSDDSDKEEGKGGTKHESGDERKKSSSSDTSDSD